MDKAELEKIRAEFQHAGMPIVLRLLDHIDALEQDKLRLDHLEKHYPRAAYQSDVGEVLGLSPASGYTIREQVDKAIAAAPEPQEVQE
jgi:hypothetical protein